MQCPLILLLEKRPKAPYTDKQEWADPVKV